MNTHTPSFLSPLSPNERATLQAAVARIFPTDDAPGAVEAGAHLYIESQLTGDLQALLPQYQAFLHALDKAAPFVSLSPMEQDAVLQALERSDEGGAFFRRFIEHVGEGFYTSPVSWELIGWKVTDAPAPIGVGHTR